MKTITMRPQYSSSPVVPPVITYWNSLPVIHDKIAKRYLVVFTEKQFEDLLKHEEEGRND